MELYNYVLGLQSSHDIKICYDSHLQAWACGNEQVLPPNLALGQCTRFVLDRDIDFGEEASNMGLTNYRPVKNLDPTHLHATFSYGKQKMLLAVLSCGGNLIFFKKSIDIIEGKNFYNHEDVYNFDIEKDKIDKILKYTKKVLNYYDMTIDIKDDISDVAIVALTKVLSSVRGSGLQATDILDAIREEVKSFFIQSCHDENLISTRHLLNSNDIYRRTIMQLYKEKISSKKAHFGRGLKIGSRVFSSLLNSGYVVQFDGTMEKEVNIVPKFCILNQEYYEIPEEWRSYKVDTIIFDLSKIDEYFNLRLKTGSGTNHPNISSSNNICIGTENEELFKQFLATQNPTTDDLVELLFKIEESLHVINYDSAFRHPIGLESKLIKVKTVDTSIERPKKLRRL